MKRVFVVAGLASPDVAPAGAEPPRPPVPESPDDVPTDAPPRSRPAKTTGLELGLRSGYGLPMGVDCVWS